MYKLIYLQDAIDALVKQTCLPWELLKIIHPMLCVLETLPSAEPEIIRCKDCKYRDENWRRVSVKWLPCMNVRTGSNWYCGSAERGEQDEDIPEGAL